MPVKGYESITLPYKTVEKIDQLVDKENPQRKTRPKVVELAINNLKEVGNSE